MKQTCLLLILDGWGHSDHKEHNAIHAAQTPNWDLLWRQSPKTLLHTSGLSVGLPDGQMGNSEVGHMTIGAGRIILQTLVAIDKDIESGQLACNNKLQNLFYYCVKENRSLHIVGLLSDGGVHSSNHHIESMCLMAAKNTLDVRIHIITDGRDTPPKCAHKFVDDLEKKIKSFQNVSIATISGRYYAMDRDENWERTCLAYDSMAYGKSEYTAMSASAAIDMAYQRGETDEFIAPTIIGKPRPMQPNDACLCMNFRADRARQITSLLLANKQKCSSPLVHDLKLATLTDYGTEFTADILYPRSVIKNSLGEYLSKHNKTQLRIAETEKYAHATFFFNGGVETEFQGESRILIPSPKVATYDLQPQMSLFEVTDRLLESIGQYDCIICNFANSDMVGHTGKMDATVKAVEAIDVCLGNIIQKIDQVQGNCFITADHGNAEKMWDEITEQPHTSHTTNQVPFVCYGSKITKLQKHKHATLADIAPTMLTCMGLDAPKEMTGKSFLAS